MERRGTVGTAGSAKEGIPVFFLMRCLLAAYILTALLLAVLALLLYKLGLGEKLVAGAIICIYVAATFFGGLRAGKRLQNRRFLWGLLVGGAYFLVLTAVSLCFGHGSLQPETSFFTTLVLCAGGGMLGGMLS